MERSAAWRAHGMNARLQQRVEFASRAGNGDAGPIHEDVNSLTRAAQRLEQEKRIGKQVFQPVVRPGDKTQGQRQQRLQVERVGCQQREVEFVAGWRAKQVEGDGPGVG